MSHVTDVILTTCLGPEGEVDPEVGGGEQAIQVINGWLRGEGKGMLHRVDDHAGGTKAIQAEVWMGAFNYLDIPAFVAVVARAPWEDCDAVALFVKDEHDLRFADLTPTWDRA